jgi:tetratricopeptide (TPR) repeat protein
MDDMTKIRLVIGVLILLPIVIAFYRFYFAKSKNKVSFNPNQYPNEAFQLSYKKFVPPEKAVPLAPVWLGRNAYYQGRFDEALNLLTQEIEAHTHDTPLTDTLINALAYRARIYRATDRLADALADYSEALRRLKDVTKPNDWTSLYFYAGCANLAAGNSTLALDLFNTLVENLRASKAGNIFYCSHPNGSRRDREQARDDLNKAITSQPKERVLYYCRALAECSLADWHNALDDLEEGLILSDVNLDSLAPSKRRSQYTPAAPSKDRLLDALKVQRDQMENQRGVAEFASQRISIQAIDDMDPGFDYAHVFVNHVFTYNMDGILYSDTLPGKSDMVISRQLIRDGWQYTGTGGSGSADDRFDMHYFKRPKQTQPN